MVLALLCLSIELPASPARHLIGQDQDFFSWFEMIDIFLDLLLQRFRRYHTGIIKLIRMIFEVKLIGY